MAFFKNICRKLLGEDEEETLKETEVTGETGENEDTEDDFVEETTEPMEVKNGKSLELKITSLNAFDSGIMEVADHLIAGRPVVLNLGGAPKEATKRIIDFFSGVAYTIRGQLKKISAGIYIVTPNNVDVTSDAMSGIREPSAPKTVATDTGVTDTDTGSLYEGF